MLLAVASIRSASAETLPPVAAPPATLDIQVHAGFDGFYKAGGWLPVVAITRNDGPPLNGTLVLVAEGPAYVAGNYGASAVLPTHSRKRLSFAAPAPTAAHNRTIMLTEGNRTLLSQTVPVSALSPRDYLYGSISPNPGTLDVLRGVRQFDGTVSVAHLSLDDIPTSGPALNDVDALVIDSTATSALSDLQRTTLGGWVSSGGQLVIGGGTGAAQTVAGLADLAPVRVTGTAVLDVGAALAPWTTSSVSDRTTVAISQPVTGSVVRLQAGPVPLVVDRPVGQGWVTFIAMSAATPSLHNAPGGARAWQRILTASRHPLDGPTVNPQVGSIGQSSAVYSLPQTVLPSGSLLAWLLFSYVLVVGPGNYVLARALGRREMLWLTIPIISVLFSGGAYLLARQIKGSDIVLNVVTIARYAGEAAGIHATTIDGAVGIFSPGRTTYDVRIASGLGITALDPTMRISGGPPPALTVLSDGASSLVQHITVQKWSLQAFAVHGNATSAASSLDASLSLVGNTVSGWLRNQGGAPLQDVVLVVGGDSTSVSDMAPGEQRDIRLVLSGTVAPVNGYPPGPVPVLGGTSSSGRRHRDLLASVMGNALQGNGAQTSIGGPEVFAFSSSALFTVQVLGHQVQEHNTTLHVFPVSVTLPTSSSTLPYGFAERELLQNSGIGGQFNSPWLSLGSTAVVQFRLPATGSVHTWNTLHVRLNLMHLGRPIPISPPPTTPNTLRVALYNWSTGAWDAQPGFGQGVQTLQQAMRYIDARGLIRLQIDGSNGQDQLQTLDIALDGGRP